MSGNDWVLVGIIVASVLPLLVVISTIRADLRPSRPGGCSVSSGLLMGYKCGLDARHDGKHETVISETFEERFGRRIKIGESKVSW